ncbi:hypothetical protein [Pseudomonas lundensis]|uniref:hypothetical protein n=1 Tax=Pseudomonas lundensis TaxID=86185 RepID=UPI000ADE8309|nr:hypothetical protein [Pseudomonas lundensis]
MNQHTEALLEIDIDEFRECYTRNAIVHNGMLDSGVHFLPMPYTVRELEHKVRAALDD